jgi:hypothetical protein
MALDSFLTFDSDKVFQFFCVYDKASTQKSSSVQYASESEACWRRFNSFHSMSVGEFSYFTAISGRRKSSFRFQRFTILKFIMWLS